MRISRKFDAQLERRLRAWLVIQERLSDLERRRELLVPRRIVRRMRTASG